MSYALRIIESIIKENNEGDNYNLFIELIESNPLWFPKKAKIDKKRSTSKLIYCVTDEAYPMSDSVLKSFKDKIQKKAEEYFDNITIVDNDDGFSIVIG